jgi:hypothetical protein
MNNKIGHIRWVIPEGYIPPGSHGPASEFTSHEALFILNANEEGVHPAVIIFYTDRDPVGPYKLTVVARRTKHFRFNNLQDPEPVPLGTPYSSVIESDVPVVVQHTRLDSRQSKNALMTTIAYPSPS